MRIILLGPTASGKSDLAVLLAEQLQTSVISADSRQCYRKLDIGTAKPSLEMRKRVKHYNIDVLDPDQEDSAMDFQKRAEAWEKEILKDNAFVIYTGGSTLHLLSLIQPFNELPEADPDHIYELQKRAEKEGLDVLYQELKKADPKYADKMDGLNRQRIIRALDVYMQTGKPFSSFHTDDPIEPDDQTLVYGLSLPREELYRRINARVDRMIAKGLVDEVSALLDAGFDPEGQSLNTVGYTEIIRYLNDEWTLDKAIEKIKTHTRRYAKRQLTWFRRWDFINWLDADMHNTPKLAEILLSDLAAKAKKG